MTVVTAASTTPAAHLLFATLCDRFSQHFETKKEKVFESLLICDGHPDEFQQLAAPERREPALKAERLLTGGTRCRNGSDQIKTKR